MKMKLKLFLLTTILILLTGCATTPKVVYVPTPVSVPKPKLSPLPTLPTLSSIATPAQFVRWCVVSNKMLEVELHGCRRQLEG